MCAWHVEQLAARWTRSPQARLQLPLRGFGSACDRHYAFPGAVAAAFLSAAALLSNDVMEAAIGTGNRPSGARLGNRVGGPPERKTYLQYLLALPFFIEVADTGVQQIMQ